MHRWPFGPCGGGGMKDVRSRKGQEQEQEHSFISFISFIHSFFHSFISLYQTFLRDATAYACLNTLNISISPTISTKKPYHMAYARHKPLLVVRSKNLPTHGPTDRPTDGRAA